MLKRATRPIRLASALAIAVAIYAGLTVRADEPLEGHVAAKVYAFERSLYLDQEKNPNNQTQRTRRIRQFFAELPDTPSKIEAIGMLDSRYVYVVPRSVMPDLLGNLLRDDDLKVRTRAVRAVRYNGLIAHFAEELLELLKQPEVDIKKTVLSAMGRQGHERFLPAIRVHLSHEDPSVRSAAVSALATWRPVEQVGDDMTAMLKDPVADVRVAAMQAIASLGPSPYAAQVVPMLKDEIALVRHRAIESLATLDYAEAAEAIVKLLGDESDSVRAAAALALGQLQSKQFMADVAQRLDDDDAIVRRYAIKAFALFKAPAYRLKLEAMLDDADDYVQREALEALASLGDKTSAPKVAEKLTHPNLLVRQSAAAAMRHVGDATYLPQVLKLLDDHDHTVRIYALSALRTFGDKSVLPRLRMLAESDPSDSIRDHARYTIEALERLAP